MRRLPRPAALLLPAVFAVLALQAPLASQEAPAESASSTETFASATPRELLRSFADAARRGEYETAALGLDLTEYRGTREPKALARELWLVLDRRLPIRPMTFSNQPEGDAGDGLPPDVEQVGEITVDGTTRAVALARIGGPEGEPVWRFSAETVSRIEELYDSVGRGWLGRYLPDPFFDISFLDMQLWQWSALLFLVLAVWIFSWPVTVVIFSFLKRLTARTETTLDDHLAELATSPFRLILAIVLFNLGSRLLDLGSNARDLIDGLCTGLGILAVAWLVTRLIDLVARFWKEQLQKQDRDDLLTLVPLGRKTAKAVVLVLAFLVLLQNVGINVAGLLAGLGIGGLAIALAAQKTVENLIGGLTIIADKIVQVDDFVKFGDKMGVIEEIGIRSTRIRTLDRTVVTVPNADFSSQVIENLAPRDKMRLYLVIGVLYDTTPDQMRFLLVNLRRMLYAHPKVSHDPARVRFAGFGASSLDVEINAYVTTKDWNEFLGIREDVYLRIMDIVEEAGTGFAFPSRTLYLSRDPGVSEEKQTEIAQQVEKMRKDGQMPLPEFSEEEIRRVDDSLDWPPEGSSQRS